MSLTKEKIVNWLEKRIEEDYFKFQYISSDINVLHFELSNNSLIIDYEFWYDGKEDEGAESFLFDFEAEEQYGVNFPSKMELIKIKGTYTWPSKEDCELLNDNLSDELENIVDEIPYHWGDPEIENFINHYINQDKKNLADMLINYYDAKNNWPKFIPEALKPYFLEIIDK